MSSGEGSTGFLLTNVRLQGKKRDEVGLGLAKQRKIIAHLLRETCLHHDILHQTERRSQAGTRGGGVHH